MFRFFPIFVCLLLDQLTKYWIFKVNHPIDLLSFLSLTPAYNEGFIFGLFDRWSGFLKNLFYFATPVAILFFLIGLLIFTKNSTLRFGISLVVGGGLGNIIDRLLLDKVRDFIDFHIGSWHYPIFNIADVCINLGIVVIAFYYLFQYKASKGD